MGVTAKEHGRELLQHGFTIEQVVHDYGDLCQSVTDLAVELSMPLSNDEFRTLNRCLDLFFLAGATRTMSEADIVLKLEQTYGEDPLTTLKIVF